jgi:hypothetical protein
MLCAGTRAGALAAAAIAAAVLLSLPGCGDSGSDGGTDPAPALDPSATEASPEAPAATAPGSDSPGELSPDETEAVGAAVRAYIGALDAHDGAGVCALFVPRAIRVGELPAAKGSCAASLEASIGSRPENGGPAWRRTTIRELKAVSVGAERARVTATVTHDFADRKYVSVEEDVIYLQRDGERWLIAKPSGTFYRAVGYPEPPLRALTPP